MKVLAVLGEGGHTREMLTLIELLGAEYTYSYLMPKHDQTSEGKIKIKGHVYRASIPRRMKPGLLTTVRLTLECSIQELVVLVQERPTAILSVGAGIAVPISIFGRLAGVKIIHVESATRVHALSLSGEIMYRVAHLFFVQWEPLKRGYPRAIYAGSLL